MDPLTICTEIGFCNLVPGGWHWIMPPIMLLLFVLILGIPVARILRRAGRSRWWTIIAFVPLLNLVGLWVFAFVRWPAVDKAPA
jgi:hypothetical protein